MKTPLRSLCLFSTLIAPLCCSTIRGQDAASFSPLPFGSTPIDYWGENDDAVSQLKRRIDAGAIVLPNDKRFGVLPALLDALKIDPESQVLKFASGSPHREIGPLKPRAIYFREDVSVAWFPGAPQIEIAVQHPMKGTLFYTLTTATDAPLRFERPQRCLACHTGPNTGANVPGWQLHSGVSIKDAEASPWRNWTSPALPFKKRWQSWYVTGNGSIPSGQRLIEELPFRKSGEYLVESSDPVALLIRDHWLLGMNLLTRWSYEHQLKQSQDKTTAALVHYLLMFDEAPLPTPLPAETAFTRSWNAVGPRDAQQRSLRDLELQSRTFRYAASPLLLTTMVQDQPRELRQSLYEALCRELMIHREMIGAERLSATQSILAATVADWPGN